MIFVPRVSVWGNCLFKRLFDESLLCSSYTSPLVLACFGFSVLFRAFTLLIDTTLLLMDILLYDSYRMALYSRNKGQAGSEYNFVFKIVSTLTSPIHSYPSTP